MHGQESPHNWRQGLPLLLTPRVVLRELRSSDAAPLWRVAHVPAVERYAWPAPSTVDGVEAFIKGSWRNRAEGKYTCFAVVPQGQSEPAGLFELRSLQPRFFRAELGLLIDPALFQSGAFEDGVRLICQFGFKTIGVRRMEIRSAVANRACNAALEKVGLQKEALLRSAFAHGGRYEDQYLWSIVHGLDRLARTD